MFKFLLALSLIFFAQTPPPAILSPQAGQVLRGKVQITGDVNIPKFSSAQVAFSYASDPGSWFLIQSIPLPPDDQTLAMWDTTLVTDGDYVLTLRIFFEDGSVQDVTVADLKIRNDENPTPEPPTSVVDESPPTATADFLTLQPAAATPVFRASTPLPPNPAAITNMSVFAYLARGGLIALCLFIFFFIILRLRRQ